MNNLKPIKLTLLFLIISSNLFSQNLGEILDERDTTYFKIYDKVINYHESQSRGTNRAIDEQEDGFGANFRRFNEYFRYRVDENGSIKTAAERFKQIIVNGEDCPADYDETWDNFGPVDIDAPTQDIRQNFGRINTVSVNPEDHNDIVAGGDNGGIWRSEDGGIEWVNVTDDDNLSIVGIEEIIRHPLDEETLYAVTKSSLTTFGKFEREEIGLGVIFSSDGGDTWELSGLSLDLEKHSELTAIAVHPRSTINNTILYAGGPTSISRYQGNSEPIGAWNEQWHQNSGYIESKDFNGIEGGYLNIDDIVVEDSDISIEKVWFCNRIGLWKKTNNNAAVRITNLPLDAQDNDNAVSCVFHPGPNQQVLTSSGFSNGKLALNKTGYIFFINKYTKLNSSCERATTQNTPLYIYRKKLNDSSNQTWDFVRISSAKLGSGLSPFFSVSPYNRDVIYFTPHFGPGYPNRKVCKITDFTSNYSPMENNYKMHDDVRHIEVIGGTKGNSNMDTIYYSNDGGIAKSINGLTWIDISGNGLTCANYYGVGINQSRNASFVFGGMDGSFRGYVNEKWLNLSTNGDNGDVLIHGEHNPYTFFQQTQNAVYRRNSDFEDFGPLGGWVHSFSSAKSKFSFPPMLLNDFHNEYYFAEDGFVGSKPITGGTTTKIQDLNQHSESLVSSLAMSNSNPNVLFFSTSQGLENDKPAELLKATKSGNNWTIDNILNTTNLPDKAISGIAVDHNNEDIIYIIFGGYRTNEQTTRRVYKTMDGGNSWTNISGCLPDVTANKIMCYDNGEDAILLGTDIGFYYTDNTLLTSSGYNWKKYGNDSKPVCIVTDIEILECSNEAIISTHGRGAWKVSLPAPKATTISTVETWDTDKKVNGDVVIDFGETLTIEDCTISFGKEAKLIVRGGGELIINNATLTSQCDFWRGIEAQGVGFVSQQGSDADLQGKVSITNNSIIEYARVGIRVGNSSDTDDNGAIIAVDNAVFRNNKRSIEYLKYRNVDASGATIDNLGKISNSHFIQDGPLPNGEIFIGFISCWAVDNIQIIGNTFENVSGAYTTVSDLGYGIHSLDASYSIRGYDNPNVFRHLKYGINHRTSLGSHPALIEGNQFENCYKAIRIRGGTNSVVINNQINLGELEVPTNRHYGIHIEQTISYTVAQNNLIGKTPNSIGDPTPEIYGILIDNVDLPRRRYTSNEVYKNRFTDIQFANLSNGDNAEIQTPQNPLPKGLRYVCNVNDNSLGNHFNFHIEKGTGIQNIQADFTIEGGLLPAGNIFENSAFGGGESSIFNIAFNSINYLHSNSNNENPLYISPTVNKVDISNAKNQCEDVSLTSGQGGLNRLISSYEDINRNGKQKEAPTNKIISIIESEIDVHKTALISNYLFKNDKRSATSTYIDSLENSFEDIRYQYQNLEKKFAKSTEFPHLDFAKISNHLQKGKELMENKNLQTYYRFLSALFTSNKNISNLDLVERKTLLELAETNDISALRAQNILDFFYGYDFDKEFTRASGFSFNQHSSDPLIEKSVAADFHNAILLYPNPVKDNLSIKFDPRSKYTTNGYLRIINPFGKIKFTGKLDQSNKQFNVNTSNWNAGVYYCIFGINKDDVQVKTFIKTE